MRTRLIGSILLSLAQLVWISCSNEINLRSDRTITEARDTFHENLINETIDAALRTPLSNSTEGLWQGAFWAMELSGYTSALTDSAVQQAMESFTNHSPGFMRSLLEVVYTSYPKTFQTEIRELLPLLNSAKLYAMAINYLLQANPALQADTLLLDLDMLYPDWSHDPILLSLVSSLTDSMASPPISDLLHAELILGLPVLFSLQPDNRDYSGVLIFRGSEGNFLRNDSGELLYIQHLARAVTNLPWYLTNGNTPPGIYSIQGLGVSDNVFIGPTPTVQTRMPFETDLAAFMHDPELKQDWDHLHYSDLLPASWQDYFPIWGSFYAGKAGRSEIIAHGSTINPEYYRNLPCYPLTPSLGCMTAFESWSPTTGELIESGQLELIHTLESLDMTTGLLVVVPFGDVDHHLGESDIQDLQ